MSKLQIILFVTVAVGSITFEVEALKRNWRYVMDKFEWNSTNEDILSMPLRTVRIGPGTYGLNGTINIGLLVDKEYKVSFEFFRSTSGSSQYHRTPFGVSKVPFPDFMNTAYKKIAMKDLHDCSNLPLFERYTPFPIGVYRLNSCIVSTDSMPLNMKDGFYKVVFDLEGPLVHVVCELIAQIHHL